MLLIVSCTKHLVPDRGIAAGRQLAAVAIHMPIALHRHHMGHLQALSHIRRVQDSRLGICPR